jgi:hypothetical protein
LDVSSWKRIGDDEFASFGKRTSSFSSPAGNYAIFIDEDDQGSVYALMGDETLRWGVDVKMEYNGVFLLSGMTFGTNVFLADWYWYEIILSSPAVISYWGDRILFRKDYEI